MLSEFRDVPLPWRTTSWLEVISFHAISRLCNGKQHSMSKFSLQMLGEHKQAKNPASCGTKEPRSRCFFNVEFFQRISREDTNPEEKYAWLTPKMYRIWHLKGGYTKNGVYIGSCLIFHKLGKLASKNVKFPLELYKLKINKKKRLEKFPVYLIECSVIEPNRTPIIRLGSVIEHNQTHNKIWKNRTKSNVQLQTVKGIRAKGFY